MIVRSRVPWPFRWAMLAVTFGFSSALAVWAFELGKHHLVAAGPALPGVAAEGLAAGSQADDDLGRLRNDRDKAQSIANTADSLLKAERTTQERLLGRIKNLEAENVALKGDLGFFERLLPMGGKGGVVVRGLQAEVMRAGQLRFQLLVMQQGKTPAEFKGRYELTLHGLIDGKSWSQVLPQDRMLQFRQYQRVEGVLDFPQPAVLQGMQIRVVDAQGGLRASEDIAL